MCQRFIALTIALLTTSALADDSSVNELARRIDQHIDARLAAENVQPAVVIDPAAFLRRATLDLAGRVPTISELDAFLEATGDDAKQQLVGQLIESPDYAYHARNQLDIMLLLREEHNGEWRKYLLEATRENRSWQQIFREVFLPEDMLSTDLRPVSYLNRRLNDLDRMTNDASVTWLGVNIACAKCHDHPLVDDWTQDHYYGMASFFKRTYRTRTGFLSERFDGVAKYTSIDGEEKQPGFVFLTGTKVEAPPLTVGDNELKKLNERIKKSEQDDKADPPPRPEFRPRSKFVELTLSDEQNRFFARNIVNRLWARFFGRGLVHPLDQMHSQNDPSHPELLSELASEMHKSEYDMRRLIHAIVLTKAYARSIRHESAGEPMADDLFAVAVPRPLSPRQLALSLRVAGQSPEKKNGLIGSEDWPRQRDELEGQAEGLAGRLAIPDDGFQVPVTEALWFSNNQSIENDVLSGSGDRLVGYLKTIESDELATIAAFRSVLSRDPTEGESVAMNQYLNDRKTRREEGLKQIVWALMCSPEFRFNH